MKNTYERCAALTDEDCKRNLDIEEIDWDNEDEDELPAKQNANWRDGILAEEIPEADMLVEALGLITKAFFGYQETRWANTKASEIVELYNRLENNICEFQAEMRDGKIYAGRTPLKVD